ncbi:MAG: M48 family metallopeptidase [Clostridia bacterium]|nr:M48 family metallopeptidase [Clostridia bacterium]MBQ2566893.1 M48 family metallopeptidase [Clostridia bacterium]MBQ3327174.1 M48 family metallopeptidase [Clostridia bacterium]MBQ3995878.1 M48 family metallopeptidase [Clostridia bacterium]MBQ5480682.1 M48 family metallopeptidase [Clostridia bacterium]
MEQISYAGVDIELLRSRRRSIGLEVRPDGSVILRVPNRLPKRDALAFLQTKEAWLRKCLDQVEERESFAEAAGLEPLTEDELSALTKAARAYFTEKCAWLAPVVGVDYGRISIRHQKTRWGSCSTKGNLNFNCLLMLAPEDVRDYVVVHELCHRKEMNHSSAFWAEVARVVPDYREKERWLKENGPLLQRRLGN